MIRCYLQQLCTEMRMNFKICYGLLCTMMNFVYLLHCEVFMLWTL